jgi:hypothetical protein
MIWGVLGVTVPVVLAVTGTAWRLAVRLDRMIADVQTQLGLRARGHSARVRFG